MNTNDWQTTRRTIRGRNKYMYNNKLHSDVEFSVVNREGKTVAVSAHKYVLAISSPVFEAMFFGELAETSRTINLPDCTAEGLLELFRFMYYDEVKLTDENAMGTKYVANKYMVPLLAQRCTQYVDDMLKFRGQKVFEILSQAIKDHDEEVQEFCWTVISKNPKKALTLDAFLKITESMLCDMLSRDSLPISELELFQAVLRWASAGNDNQQNSKNSRPSKRVISLVRFPLIRGDDFINHVLTANVLDVQEIVEIADFHNSSDKSVLKTFKSEERDTWVYKEPKCLNCYRFGECEQVVDFPKDKHSITFTATREVWLSDIDIYALCASRHCINFSIYKGYCPVYQLCEEYFEGKDLGTYNGFTILLEREIFIEPCEDYTLQIQFIERMFDTNLMYYGPKGSSVVEFDNGTRIFFKNTSNGGKTSVESGQFPKLTFMQLVKSLKRPYNALLNQ